jgi:hypothetical protein
VYGRVNPSVFYTLFTFSSLWGRLAERVGFEPTYSLLGRNPISSRTRYDLFGTSPAHESTKNPGLHQIQCVHLRLSPAGNPDILGRVQGRGRALLAGVVAVTPRCDFDRGSLMSRQSVYARMAKLSAIITVLPASMAAGWFLGYYVIDGIFGTYPWGAISLTLLGAGAGFYEIIRILAIDRQDSGD